MRLISKLLISSILIGVTNFLASAYDFKVDGLCYSVISASERTCAVAQNTEREYTGDITIPSKVMYDEIEFTVTQIGPQAFENCQSLSSLTIPPSVTDISSWVFTNCYGLNKVILQDSDIPIHLTYNDATSSSYNEGVGTFVKTSLREIYIGRPIEFSEKKNCGYSPFYKLKSLRKVEFSSHVKTFGTRCFYECSNLNEIIFSESIQSISDFSFIGCTSLTRLSFKEGLTTIGVESFKGCTGLVEISFPQSLETIKSSFRNCTSLVSVEIPETTLNVGDYAFAECSSLKYIKLPSQLKSIPQALFNDCTSLESVDIPVSVTNLGNDAFSNCTALTTITIPDAVTQIGSSCFSYCTNLKELIIPENVTYLGWTVFDGCSNLGNLYVKPNTPPTCESKTFAESLYIKTSLHVAPDAMDVYINSQPWSNFLKILPYDSTGVTNILDNDIPSANMFYDVNGHTITSPTHGLYIEKLSDGTFRKILKLLW